MSVAAAATLRDEVEINSRYRFYRPRILTWSIVGYAMFYFLRKNLPIAMPVMEQQLGITKTSLGTFLTIHGLLYGVSKFANGIVGDRVNARYFMAAGLLCSAVLNVCFGFSTAVIALGIFWMLNGWFQGMGFPPCARLMTHWFSPRELATKMSIWNMSHGIGAATVLVLCGYLLKMRYDWRICFFVPAALAIATAGLVLLNLRDTPESVGLPPVAGTQESERRGDEATRGRRGIGPVLRERVFANRWIWIFSVANFFVYTIRYAVLDWAPTMLKESKGVTLANAAWMTAAFEVAGVIGALCAGWLTDRLFGGRGARMCVFCMLFTAGAIAVFWWIPPKQILLNTLVLAAAGFFIYGPQALVGICAANLATKEAAASAVGLTGFFGYASGVVSGWGMGYIVEHWGWDRAFTVLLIAAGAGFVMFVLNWNAPRDGYAPAGEASRP